MEPATSKTSNRRAVVQFVLVIFCLLPQVSQAEILVAAASSVRQPLDQLVERFEQAHGERVVISYGASGRLTHQILRGAPFALFLSADEAYTGRIVGAGLAAAEPTVYAVGTIGLFSAGPNQCGGEGLEALAQAVQDGNVHRIAIANPEIAPYGKATQQLLQHAGLWKIIEPHLVFAESAAQAAQFGLTGAVDCAFIAHSHGTSGPFEQTGRYRQIPPTRYAPVRHAMVKLSKGETPDTLFTFLQSAEAIAVFEAAGFSAATE